MYGKAGLLNDFFYKRDQEFVAVLQANDGCKLQKYAYRETVWQLVEEMLLPFAGLAVEQVEAISSDNLRELAEQTAMAISRKGWQGIPLIYIVPETEQLSYVLNLPPGLDTSEQQEAAYWEFDDKLLAQGLNAENFTCVCCSNDETGSCTITGVRKGYLQEVEKIFAQAELVLADMIPASGMERYLPCKTRELAGFMRRPGASLAGRRILACWFSFLLAVGAVLFVLDVIHYWQASALAEKQQNELALLAAQQQEMQTLTTMAAGIAKREENMQRLSRQGMPWYSLLVHLGANTTQGVALIGVNANAEEKALQLEGMALNYDCLAEFVGRCEADKLFFAKGVTLENSAIAKGSGREPDKVKFSVSVNWEWENNGQVLAENHDLP